jgi:hypothetical protein
MRVSRTANDELTLEVRHVEFRALRDLLQLFPLTPVSHHRLTRTAAVGGDPDDQQLLEESIRSRKEAQRSRIRKFLARRRDCRRKEGICTIPVRGEEIEWLLQVLNDLRVGSWLELGCPETLAEHVESTPPRQALMYFAMEFCGLLEMKLLQALQDLPPPTP